MKITHPIDARSEPSSDTSLMSRSSQSPSSLKTCGAPSTHSSSGSSDILREMLVLPQPKERSRKRKKALNSKAVCITDLEILEELKSQEATKLAEEQEKERKKLEREEKNKNAVLEKEKKSKTKSSKDQQDRVKNKIQSCTTDHGELH